MYLTIDNHNILQYHYRVVRNSHVINPTVRSEQKICARLLLKIGM